MTFDAQLQSLTQDEIVPAVVDSALSSNVMTMLMMANGKPWAGESLKFPVKLSISNQRGSFADYDDFSTQSVNVRQVASFDPRAYYASVTIGGIAKTINGISKSKVLDLIAVEMESACQDMGDGLGTVAMGDGTGNSNKDFLGLDAGIDDGTGVATYGGLSRATYTAWASVLQTAVGAFDLAKHRTLMNSASVGGRKPSVFTCPETVFGYVEADYTAVVQGNYSAVEAVRGRLGKNGIKPAMRDGLTFQGGADVIYFGGTPVIKDDKEDSGKLRATNLDFYHWYGAKPADTNPVDLKPLYHKGNDQEDNAPSGVGFGWTGFVKPHDQYAFTGQFIVIGNFLTAAPRLHSSSAGITS